MNRALARLLGWTAGYLVVVALERVAYAAGVDDSRRALDDVLADLADEDSPAEPAPPLLAVVVADATSPCVCCRAGAATPPPGAAR